MPIYTIQKKQNEKSSRVNSAKKVAGHEKSSDNLNNNIPHLSLINDKSSYDFSIPIQNANFFQRTIGNQEVGRFIQAKLKIGQPNDKYEQEADRVADAVMSMPEPRAPQGTIVSRQTRPFRNQRTCLQDKEELRRQPEEEEEFPENGMKPGIAGIGRLGVKAHIDTIKVAIVAGYAQPDRIQRLYSEYEKQLHRKSLKEEENSLHTSMVPDMASKSCQRVEANINTLGGGHSLPDSVRDFFESRFGYDFTQVRIHTDARAAETARAFKAQAFTMGHDIVLGAGQYAPQTVAGKSLLAHELTHVVQQRGSMMQCKTEHGSHNNVYKPVANYASDAISDFRPIKLIGLAGGITRSIIQLQPTARRGDVGCPVPELQEKLNVTGARLVIDGRYGPLTEASVTAFQNAHPLLNLIATAGESDLPTWAFLRLAAPGNHGLPSGETTNSRSWGTGVNATIHRWQQRLGPIRTSFANCEVTEADPGGGSDTCHFPGSAYAPFTTVTGGTWPVDARNQWGDDWVGWFTHAVTYYRNQGRAPCRATLPQSMRVVRPGGNVEYVRHNLYLDIGTNTVSSTRAGRTATRRWP